MVDSMTKSDYARPDSPRMAETPLPSTNLTSQKKSRRYFFYSDSDKLWDNRTVTTDCQQKKFPIFGEAQIPMADTANARLEEAMRM